MICNRGLKIIRLGGAFLKTDLVDKQHELCCSPDATHIPTPQGKHTVLMRSGFLGVGSESRLSRHADTVAGWVMKCGDILDIRLFTRPAGYIYRSGSILV
jgi:hypothetical protein